MKSSVDTPESARPYQTVQSVERALAVIDALSATQDALSTSAVARVTRLNRTVVHRLLKTLEAKGYVQGSEGRYTLGPATLLAGAVYTERMRMRRSALPYLVELNQQVAGESPFVVSMSVPVGEHVVVVERVWNPSGSLSSLPSLRSELPIRRCAHGRVMLAGLPRAAAERIIGTNDYEAMEERLDGIRRAGLYEAARSEISPGISSMAAAILGQDGDVVGCVALSGPDNLMADATDASEAVKDTAGAIGRSMLP